MNYTAIYVGSALLSIALIIGGAAGVLGWGIALIIAIANGLVLWAVHEHEERHG